MSKSLSKNKNLVKLFIILSPFCYSDDRKNPLNIIICNKHYLSQNYCSRDFSFRSAPIEMTKLVNQSLFQVIVRIGGSYYLAI